MAQTPVAQSNPWISPSVAAAFKRYVSLVVPVGIVSLIGVIIIPLPPFAMDLLISLNLALAAVIMLTTVYVSRPLEFSVFPSLLLATTLFRLVLNVASTRLILSAESASPEQVTGVAGQVIEAFGGIVTGGSMVAGLIIFVIIIIIQFVVITKGATRISEVAARFQLDAMPGKQMAIDADLNAGIIEEGEARHRRQEINDESNFYGAMDGASKFVRGDAIAGVVITLINIIGGIAVGVMVKGWDLSTTVSSFTKLTIGDGLVSQIPSFIIAIAAGLIVTRSSSKEDLGSELTGQLVAQPVALMITAVFLIMLAFTGMPPVPMLSLGLALAFLSWSVGGKAKVQAKEAAVEAQKEAAAKKDEPQPVEKLLNVDALELEIGYGLVKLVDAKQGGDLLDRVAMTRRTIAAELGLLMPPVRIHDNMQLQPNEYRVKIRSNFVAGGVIHPGKFLAMDSGVAEGAIEGQKTREPAFGLEAVWIEPNQKQHAEILNYTVVEASNVLATHLSEIVKEHAAELMTREETNKLLEQLKEKSPKLVEQVVGENVKVGVLQKVMQNLLAERVPVRDLETILETIGDWAQRTEDVLVLSEYTRDALRRTICSQYAVSDPETGASRLYCVTLDPSVEDLINGYTERGNTGTTMTLPPSVSNQIVEATQEQLQKLIAAGHHPLVLVISPQVRAQVYQLLSPKITTVAVLGSNEVSKGVEVESVGMAQVALQAEGAADLMTNQGTVK